MIKNGVIFFDSCWKEGFKFYESYFSNRVLFCESYLKGSILWVLFKKRSNNLNHKFENEGLISLIQIQKKFTSTSHKKVLLLESDNLLGSNSLSPFVKRVQFFESNFGNPVHFLWVMLKRVQLCDFLKKNKYWQKNSILGVTFKKKVVQFCESYSKNIQFFALYFFKKFN